MHCPEFSVQVVYRYPAVIVLFIIRIDIHIHTSTTVMFPKYNTLITSGIHAHIEVYVIPFSFKKIYSFKRLNQKHQ